MKKTCLKLISMLVAVMIMVLLSSVLAYAAVEMNDEKYQDSVTWSDKTLYTAKEIKMNVAAGYNITQYTKDLAAEVNADAELLNPDSIATAPANIVADNDPTTATPAQDDILTNISATDDVAYIVANWDSELLADIDRYTVWDSLSDDLRVAVWKQLKPASQVTVLTLNKQPNWLPMETVCRTYGKKDMLRLWAAIKSITKTDIRNTRIADMTNVSNFDKFRMVTYLSTTSATDKAAYIKASKYNVKDTAMYAKLLPTIIKAIATESDEKFLNAINGKVILFESHYSNFSDETIMITDIFTKVTNFMAECNNKLPIR